MAVHSKSLQARTSAATGRRHLPHRHGPRGLEAGEVPGDGEQRDTSTKGERPGTLRGHPLLPARPRKRGRIDALFPDAAATPPKKQKRVTGEYPIRSRPMGTTTTTAGLKPSSMADEKGRGRRTKAAQPPPSASLAPPPPPPAPAPTTAHATIPKTAAAAPAPAAAAAANQTAPPAKNRSTSRPTSVKEEEEQQQQQVNGVLESPAVNGINAASSRTIDRRALRSQDGGSRSRSELSLYFPNYDELISNEPKKTELLTADTRVFITEDPPRSPKTVGKTFVLHSPARLPPNKVSPQKRKNASAIKPSPIRPGTSLNHYQTLDFSNTLAKLPRSSVDPLPAEFFATAHRRSERQEKQLRNIEKERAQHEKVQLERLYEGLRGPDWLRVMGISGVTEGDRKAWEGKRAFFVKEVGALLEKFRIWKEEEKRRKIEKEEKDQHGSDDSSAEEEEQGVEEEPEEVEDEDEEEEEIEEGGELEEVDDSDAAPDSPEDIEIPDSDAAPSSPPRNQTARGRRVRSPLSVDVDALAAQQLHTEALLSAKHPPAGWGKASSSSSSANSTPAQATHSKMSRGGRGGASNGAPSRGRGTGPSTKATMNGVAAAEGRGTGRGGGRGKQPAAAELPDLTVDEPPADTPEQPLTSFFRKAHQRHSALAAGRRHTGRVQFAFGQPIPELGDGEFNLPQGMTTADAQRASARSRRARKRGVSS